MSHPTTRLLWIPEGPGSGGTYIAAQHVVLMYCHEAELIIELSTRSILRIRYASHEAAHNALHFYGDWLDPEDNEAVVPACPAPESIQVHN